MPQENLTTCSCALAHGKLSPEAVATLRRLSRYTLQRKRIADAPWWKRMLCKIIGHTMGNYMWVDHTNYTSYSECGRCCRPIISYDMLAAGWEIDTEEEATLQRRGR